ncbi:hypothetical protein LCGC14_1244320 [marine sediment metagenome]|uniref:Uncharacterized protein n=1 Tax=marine sediment metagenome TaxID=412755 RepID=A0A0F9L8Q7_9ZZZZ
MYCNPNFPSKKALKAAVANGDTVTTFSPGPFPCPTDGVIALEGPHFPKPHRWYASVKVAGGRVVKVLS